MTIGHSIFFREVEFADVLVIKVDLVTDEQRAFKGVFVRLALRSGSLTDNISQRILI